MSVVCRGRGVEKVAQRGKRREVLGGWGDSTLARAGAMGAFSSEKVFPEAALSPLIYLGLLGDFASPLPHELVSSQ